MSRLYKHKKTGLVYEVISDSALIEADLTLAVIYRSVETGQYWVRSAFEFFDGRFEALTSDLPEKMVGSPINGDSPKKFFKEYGEANLALKTYNRYVFTFEGGLGGRKITVKIGGDAAEIYRLDLSRDRLYRLNEFSQENILYYSVE